MRDSGDNRAVGRRRILAMSLVLLLLCPTILWAESSYLYEDFAQEAIGRQAEYGYPPQAYAWVQPSDLATQETLMVLLVCLYENIKQVSLSDAQTLPEEDVLYDEDSPVEMEVRRQYMRKAFNAGFAVLDNLGVFDTAETVDADGLTQVLSSFLSAMEDEEISKAEALDHMETSANRYWGEIYQEDDFIVQTPISNLTSGELANQRLYVIVDDLIDAYGWEIHP